MNYEMCVVVFSNFFSFTSNHRNVKWNEKNTSSTTPMLCVSHDEGDTPLLDFSAWEYWPANQDEVSANF